MTNKYVNFVTDQDFLECVSWVISGYSSKIDVQKNVIDPFKIIFDIKFNEMSYHDWEKNEKIRQLDKTINNKIGEFHQKLLGKAKGWSDLGIGHISKVDLKNDENTIFIELKNKYNTMNSDALDKCRDKLESISLKYPNSENYWAFIIPKNGKSEETVWYKKDRKKILNIKKLTGKKIYELVTGDEKSLENTWRALPKAINDLMNISSEFSYEELSILENYFIYAFDRK